MCGLRNVLCRFRCHVLCQLDDKRDVRFNEDVEENFDDNFDDNFDVNVYSERSEDARERSWGNPGSDPGLCWVMFGYVRLCGVICGLGGGTARVEGLPEAGFRVTGPLESDLLD